MMELLFIDPFEAVPVGTLYNNNAVARYIPGLSGPAGNNSSLGFSFHVVDGVLSRKALSMPFASAPSTRYMTIDSGSSQQSASAVWGFAFSLTRSESVTQQLMDIPLGPSGYETVTLQGGSLSFLGSTGQFPIQTDVYNYLELVVNLDNGTFSIYINNQELFNGTHSYSFLRNQVRWSQGVQLPGHIYYDDIYHLGGTTGPFNDRLGPVRALRAPLLETTEANFTPINAPTNIAAVNKDSLSVDEYNRSPASDDLSDLFKIDTTEIPEDKDIIAVSHQLLYRKSDIGPRRLDAVVKLGSSVESKQLPDNLGVFGGHTPLVLTQKPGGGALDITSLDEIEFGYEVKAQ